LAEFDPKAVHRNDWGVIGGGVAVFVASFMRWFGFDFAGMFEVSRTGWNSGLLAWLGILCAVSAAAVVAALVIGAALPSLPLGWRSVVLALAAVATLCLVLTLGVGSTFQGLSLGRSFGLFLALIAAIVQAVFAYLAFAASGETVDLSKLGTRAGSGGAATPAPPTGPPATGSAAPAADIPPPTAPGYLPPAAPPAAGQVPPANPMETGGPPPP
jgi:hypothetical protein